MTMSELTSVLDSALVDRLIKLCGMSGNEYEGERANAAALADRIVSDAGLTWVEVIKTSQLDCLPNNGVQIWREPETLSEQTTTCLAWSECLSDYERDFCRSIAGKESLTQKQWALLERLTDKAREYAAARGAL